MSEARPTKEEKKAFIKKFEAKAAEQGMTPAEYLAATATDQVRETMLQMIKAEQAYAESLSGGADETDISRVPCSHK